MKGNILWGTGLLLVLSVTVVAYGFTVGSARSDCPGKVVCEVGVGLAPLSLMAL